MRGASQKEVAGAWQIARITPPPPFSRQAAEYPEDPQVPQNRKEVDPPRHVRHGPATGGGMIADQLSAPCLRHDAPGVVHERGEIVAVRQDQRILEIEEADAEVPSALRPPEQVVRMHVAKRDGGLRFYWREVSDQSLPHLSGEVVRPRQEGEGEAHHRGQRSDVRAVEPVRRRFRRQPRQHRLRGVVGFLRGVFILIEKARQRHITEIF
jgi:hypothetical protein